MGRVDPSEALEANRGQWFSNRLFRPRALAGANLGSWSPRRLDYPVDVKWGLRTRRTLEKAKNESRGVIRRLRLGTIAPSQVTKEMWLKPRVVKHEDSGARVRRGFQRRPAHHDASPSRTARAHRARGGRRPACSIGRPRPADSSDPDRVIALNNRGGGRKDRHQLRQNARKRIGSTPHARTGRRPLSCATAYAEKTGLVDTALARSAVSRALRVKLPQLERGRVRRQELLHEPLGTTKE
jgi:hypothetical protein